MKARALVILLGLILSAAQISYASKTESGSGIVYGEQHAFMVTAPPGWILDNESAADQGIHAAFYPKGSSWDQAPAVMYANSVRKHKGVATVQDFINSDIARFKKGNPKIVISEGRTLKTEDGKTAQVRLFQGDQWGNWEAVAYIDEPAVVAILVLSARSQEAFKKSFPAFEKLVASYRFYTEDVKMPKPKNLESQTPK